MIFLPVKCAIQVARYYIKLLKGMLLAKNKLLKFFHAELRSEQPTRCWLVKINRP